MHLQKVSTQVSLRISRRLTGVETFLFFDIYISYFKEPFYNRIL